MLLTIFLLVSLLLVYLINVYVRHRRLRTIIHLPGPKNHFFFGNTNELWSTKYFSRLIQTWTNAFGKTYVYYEGQTPVYVSSDVEFLQQVFTKKFFTNFPERKKTPFERQVDQRLTNLVSANAKSWKHQRHIINPAFSPTNLKAMSPTMNHCLDLFFTLLLSKFDHDFDIYEMYRRLSIDILLQCEFGTKTNVQTEPDNPYIKGVSGFFNVDLRLNIFAKAGLLVPTLADLFLNLCMKLYRTAAWLRLIKPVPIDWVIQTTEKMVRDRLNQTQKDSNRIDLVQMLVDAKSEDSTDPQTKLTINEIVSNSVIFLLAGYESTSSALAFCTYILATNPSEQQRLQQEIDSITLEGNHPIYDELQNKFFYLDLFVQEVLRIFPIGNIACTRRCILSTKIGDIAIEQDAIIQMDMYSLHYSKELWGPVDPNIFYPDRHREKRNRLAFASFGCGPKSCVGQRFALFIIKLTLVRLLKNYKILPGSNIDQRLNIQERSTIAPTQVWIRLEHRQQ